MASQRLRHAALVAITFAVSSGAIVGCSSHDSNPLFANAWTLASASDAGVPVVIPQDREIRWQFLHDGCGNSPMSCPDGTKLVRNDVCNDFVVSIDVDRDRVVWRDGGESSAVGCAGGLTDTLRDFFQNDSTQYVVANDQLRLTSSDGTIHLTLRRSDSS